MHEPKNPPQTHGAAQHAMAQTGAVDDLKSLIREVQNFPIAGVSFRDITPLLEDARAFRSLIDALAARYRDQKIDKVVGIESRGFILGSALAYALSAGLVLLRKPGKLPRQTINRSYSLEYGEAALHLHTDAVAARERVLLVDDVLATGGTLSAGAYLLHQAQATLVEMAVVIELPMLHGRQRLSDPLFALMEF